MVDYPLPRIRRDEKRHQEKQQSQKIDVYQANAIVFVVVRREDVSEKSHNDRFYVWNREYVAAWSNILLLMCPGKDQRTYRHYFN